MANASQRFQQFQVAPRIAVERHEAFGGVAGEPLNLADGAALCLLQVIEDGSGGTGGQGFAFDAEGGERGHVEMAQQGLAGTAFFKTPGGQVADGFGLIVEGDVVFRHEQFGGIEPRQFFGEGTLAVSAG